MREFQCEGLEAVSCAGHPRQVLHKWFMAKAPQKVFGKDVKYKVKVHVQEVSEVQEQEYKDVDLDGNTYKRTAISRLLTDDEAKDVSSGKTEEGLVKQVSGTKPSKEEGLQPCIG